MPGGTARELAQLFQYTRDLDSVLTTRDVETFVAQVPGSVRDVEELFKVLWAALRLPGYFGFNWDALDECLNDFEWLRERRVVLVHVELPTRLEPEDLRLYLEVLAGAVERWSHDYLLDFSVVFHEDSRAAVIDALGDPQTSKSDETRP